MFTGIIQAIGEVAQMQPSGGDLRLRIRTGKLQGGYLADCFDNACKHSTPGD